MKKKEFVLSGMTDIKIFILFLLDNIHYPLCHETLMNIIFESTESITLDYDECLRELVDAGHVSYDDVDGVRYYALSDSGRMIAAELYDSLDPNFLSRSLKAAAKYISLSESGITVRSALEKTENQHYRVTLEASDKNEKLMSLTLTVSSRAEAEQIIKHYESRPDAVFRGVFLSATGRTEFMA